MNFIARSKFLFTNLVGKFGLNIWAPIPNQWYENTSRHDKGRNYYRRSQWEKKFKIETEIEIEIP